MAFLAAMTVPLGLVPIIAVATSEEGETIVSRDTVEISLISAESTPTPLAAETEPHLPRVGIIAGHSGYDSGAVCPDGLQEVAINSDIAQRVVSALQSYGWQVDLLQEFDVRLNAYLADALVSIHADSCGFAGKTGFKVARAEASYVPEPEDRLVQCLSVRYAQQTGLPFDAHTITYDMTRYHAYYEVNPATPAAIIEVGFMLDDRELLTQRPDLVAQGIANGIVCFIEAQAP